MEIAGLVALVITITQVIKGILKIDPNIIAFAVTIGVVGYKAVATGTPVTLVLLIVFLEVLVGAVGAFKVGQQLFENKSPAK